jgi:predicted lysophospholipase L1 biosynthesis ABC-type transport system permease subunit
MSLVGSLRNPLMAAIRPLSGVMRTSAQRVIRSATALGISLSVALLGGLDLGPLALFALALALLGLCNLPSVVLENSLVARVDIGALGRFAYDERVRAARRGRRAPLRPSRPARPMADIRAGVAHRWNAPRP